MANNYCESSSLLSLTPEQLERAKPIIEKTIEDIEKDVGFQVEYEERSDGLWLGGNEIVPGQVAQIAQAVVDGLEINDPFVFSWSYSCSKLRLDEFGGGACCVRRGQEAIWVDAVSTVLQRAAV